MNCLPDINVWLALTFSAHPHHAASVDWFDAKDAESCLFCRMTQQGFLRLATNPKVFQSDALTMSEAWHAFDTLISDERVWFEAEPPLVEKEWRSLTGDESYSPKIWNDSFLAAVAKSAGLQLVTFDKGFRRYGNLNLALLSAP